MRTSSSSRTASARPAGSINIDRLGQLGDVPFETLKIGGKSPAHKDRSVPDQRGRALHTRRCAPGGAARPRIPGLRKLKSTYVDTLPDMVDPRAGCTPLPPGRGRHRAVEQASPESAEHPHPHREGSGDTQGLRAQGRDHLLLSADYSRSSCGASRT